MKIREIKDIIGYEGLYQISNEGEVISLQTETKNYCVLKPFLSQGYKTVKLSKGERIDRKQHQIHRLVAIHFIPNPDNKPQVNHIDCDTTNNTIENLEWVTHRENRTHAIVKNKKNSSIYTGVSWNKERQMWSSQIGYKGKIIHLGFYFSEDQASIAYKCKCVELKIENKYAVFANQTDQ